MMGFQKNVDRGVGGWVGGGELYQVFIWIFGICLPCKARIASSAYPLN